MTFKERRLRAGLTQGEVAERAGLKRSIVSHVECGYKTRPITLAKIEAALDGRRRPREGSSIPFDSEEQERQLREIWRRKFA